MVQKHQRIKILYSIPNFDTAGSGKALLKVAQNLDPAIFEPHIMCMHNKGTFFKVVQQSGIPIHLVQYTTQMKPYYLGLWNCFKVSKIFRKISPDIIHSFHYSADYSEPLAAKMARIKWVYTKKNMNWGSKSKNGWKLRSFFADAIAAQNTDMLQEFFPNSKKAFLIQRGVDLNEFKPIEPQFQLRKLWNIKEDKRILMCVANLVPVKGIEILLKAFSKVCNEYNDWIVLIVGDNTTEYGIKMIKLVKDLKIMNKVVFTGKQVEINNYLSIAEVFVLPTLNEGRKEGSPVSLIEAMACGKYVLASNISGIKDQLKDFPQNLVAAGSIKKWEIALTNVFRTSSILVKVEGEKLRKFVIRKFSIMDEVEKTEELYKSLIK